jgi:hypothetical protein
MVTGIAGHCCQRWGIAGLVPGVYMISGMHALDSLWLLTALPRMQLFPLEKRLQEAKTASGHPLVTDLHSYTP